HRQQGRTGRGALPAAERTDEIFCLRTGGRQGHHAGDEQMTRLPIIGALVLVVLFLAYSAIFIVTPRQQAIVLRFGEITRVVAEPGLYFKLPTRFVDSVQFVDNRILRLDLENLRVQVRDGRRYLVDAFIAFRIEDPRKFRKTVSGNLDLLEANLRT